MVKNSAHFNWGPDNEAAENKAPDVKRLAALGAAAAGIAHDINNELTLILNYISLSERNGRYREVLLDATTRCAHMTSSLLAWSRGESVSPKPLVLPDFLREFPAKLSIPKTTRLHLQVFGANEPVLCDADALDRILRNLVKNALAAMNDNGEIWITAFENAITVQDSGTGVERGTEAKIFEPFYSGKKKRARGASGSGLGLAIVRELMAQQGGSIRLISEPGQGACFELRFQVAAIAQ